MPAPLALPAADPAWGHFRLGDHSVIYASNVRPGQWFAWVCRGSVKAGDGKGEVKVGEVLMDRQGVLYFANPADALRAIERARRGR